MKVELIVLDYLESKVYLYKNLDCANVSKDEQIERFLVEHKHELCQWMLREKIEIIERS